MEKWQVALCERAETSRPALDWPSHLGWWPISVRQGRALGHSGAGGGTVGFRRRPTMRCSGEDPGSKAVGWWTRFGGSGKVELTGRTCSTARCGWLEGNGSGCVVRGWWSIACSAGRLYTAARCSGHGRIGRREAGAGCPRWLNGGGNGGAVGAKGRGGRKGAPRWGVGALYSRQRRWTTAAWRWENGGQGNSSGEVMGMSKAVATAVWRRSARSGRRRFERLTLGAHGVLIFPIYSKLAQLRNRKRMPYLAPKILKFFILLYWWIMNKFLNCADIQISIDVELKFLEQIHKFELLVNF
jgi:hypothetical protein